MSSATRHDGFPVEVSGWSYEYDRRGKYVCKVSVQIDGSGIRRVLSLAEARALESLMSPEMQHRIRELSDLPAQ